MSKKGLRKTQNAIEDYQRLYNLDPSGALKLMDVTKGHDDSAIVTFQITDEAQCPTYLLLLDNLLLNLNCKHQWVRDLVWDREKDHLAAHHRGISTRSSHYHIRLNAMSDVPKLLKLISSYQRNPAMKDDFESYRNYYSKPANKHRFFFGYENACLKDPIKPLIAPKSVESACEEMGFTLEEIDLDPCTPQEPHFFDINLIKDNLLLSPDEIRTHESSMVNNGVAAITATLALFLTLIMCRRRFNNNEQPANRLGLHR